MFETNDDFVFDDELLGGVFENDQEGFDTSHHTRVKQHQSFFRPIENTVNTAENEPPAGFVNSNHTEIGFRNNVHQSRESNTFSKGGVNEINPGNKQPKNTSPDRKRPKRERKFPGPAGLLPERRNGQNTPLKLDYLLETETTLSEPTPDDLCSQGKCSGSVLEEEPWQSLLIDLGGNREILDEVNVASIKKKAAARCFSGKKVPFLAAVLHHLDVSSPDPCIILRDKTGEIHGTLHREVWEQFAGELIIGTVIVVRNVGLLSTGYSSRRHYLNITANNIVTIYAAKSDKLRKTWLHSLTPQDVAKTIQDWRSLVSPSHGLGSTASVGSPALFNTSLSPYSPSPLINSHVPSPRQFEAKFGNSLMQPSVGQKFHSTPLRHPAQQSAPCTLSSPRLPRQTVPLRPMAKNLNQLFLPNVSKNSQRPCVSNIVPRGIRPSSNVTNTITLNDRGLNQSSSLASVRQGVTSNFSNALRETSSNSSSFNFNPVIVTSNPNNNVIFPSTSKVVRSNIQPNMPLKDQCIKSDSSACNNNSLVILSQSSQLTAEEQSFVENVFDGIDADSLFDDDF